MKKIETSSIKNIILPRLQIGDQAPDFTLPTLLEKTISLKAMRGKPVVLYFYPKANTSGCTKEACSFETLLPEFKKLHAEILAVSRDPLKILEKFAQKYSLTFPLLSDCEGSVTEQYGVWVEKSMYGKKYFGIERSTFLIDTEGKISALWRKVSVTGHAEAVQKALIKLLS